jgi:hypothetical protein
VIDIAMILVTYEPMADVSVDVAGPHPMDKYPDGQVHMGR